MDRTDFRSHLTNNIGSWPIKFSFEEVSLAKKLVEECSIPERTSNGTIDLYRASSSICFRINSFASRLLIVLGSFIALGTDNLQGSLLLKDLAPILLQLVRLCDICLKESDMSNVGNQVSVSKATFSSRILV